MIGSLLKKLMYYSVAGRLKHFYSSLDNPERAQYSRFNDIIGRNSSTGFGVEHAFGSVKSVEDYKKAVPIRDYTGFAPYIESMLAGEDNVLVSEPVSMFGVTSGSTAKPKFIPVTRSFTVEYHNSHLLWMYNMVKDRSDGVIGSILSMVSPAEEGRTAGGIPYGSSSGKQYRDQSIPIRALHPIPYPVFLIEDLKAKYHVALTLALRKDIRVVNSVNPSTLIMIADILAEKGEEFIDDIAGCAFSEKLDISEEIRGRLTGLLKPVPDRVRELKSIIKRDGYLRPKTVWPGICAVNTWQGGNAPFYLGRVGELWGDAPQRCLGLRATEGMFTIPLGDFTPSAVLAVDGHFLEFVEDGTEIGEGTDTLLAHELEVGRRYRMIITTSSGLYRYDLGDIVEVTGMRGMTPEVAFLHKAGGVLSVTGEKVYEDQVVGVMAGISSRLGYEINGFSVTVEMADEVRYALVVELPVRQNKGVLQELIDTFDNELSGYNIEYSQKRASGRIGRPILITLAGGAYNRYREWLISRGRPDGQVKPPHILKPDKEGRISSQTHEFFGIVDIEQRYG